MYFNNFLLSLYQTIASIHIQNKIFRFPSFLKISSFVVKRGFDLDNISRDVLKRFNT